MQVHSLLLVPRVPLLTHPSPTANNQQLTKSQRDNQHPPHQRADSLYNVESYKESSSIKGATFLPTFCHLSTTQLPSPSAPLVTMQDFYLLLLVLLIDSCSMIIRVSTGEWTTQAKLGLLASHLALLGQLAHSRTNCNE